MRTLCSPRALCRLRSAPSPRSGFCWRRSPTSPLCGAIRIGWRSIRPCLRPGLRERASGSFWRWACFLAAGPRRARLFGQIAATAVGASAVLGAQVVAMLPEGMRASILAAFAPPANGDGAAQSLLWTPVRAAAGDPQRDSRLDGVRRRRLRARLRAFRRALRARGDRLCGRAGQAGGPSEGDGALWRERQRGLAHQGAARRLARPLADVATSFAGRLYDAARCHSLAQRRPDGHGRGRLHAGSGRDRGATRRARCPGSRFRPRTRRIFLRPLPCRGRQSNAPRSPPSASRSRSSSPCPSPHWPSPRPGLGFARFCSAPERSPRPRWSISGDRRHRVVASCCVVIRSRSSSA